jgi:hypothetical protein
MKANTVLMQIAIIVMTGLEITEMTAYVILAVKPLILSAIANQMANAALAVLQVRILTAGLRATPGHVMVSAFLLLAAMTQTAAYIMMIFAAKFVLAMTMIVAVSHLVMTLLEI